MKVSGKTLLRIFVTAGIVVCLGIGYFVCSTFLNIDRYERAYPHVKIGDSKERVIQLLGKPDRIESCNSDTLPNSCAEKYVYLVIFGRKAVYFDKDGKVIEKRESASG